MIVHSRQLSNRTLEADVCIIGGGAAGIAVAMGLLDSSLRVVLLEGGGAAPADRVRSPPRLVAGRDARPSLEPDTARRWYLGGNTNTWAGNCRPFDEADFDARPWVNPDGWPITRDDLVPWYEQAQGFLGLGDFALYDVERVRSSVPQRLLDVDPAIASTRIMQVCPVPSVAAIHRERLEAETSLRVVLGAEALGLVADAPDRVTAVEVAFSDGRRGRIEAGTYVLAAGGVENARLLLASNDVAPSGLGNDHDLVGRYFMDHWWFDVPLGEWAGRDVSLYSFDASGREAVEGQQIWAQLSLSHQLMHSEGAPGLVVWFVRRSLASTSVVAAEMLLLSALRRVPADPATDFRLLLADVRSAPAHLAKRWRKRAAGAPEGAHTLMVQLEQRPDPENRLRLSSERDALGRQKLELALRLSQDERGEHERTLAIVARELGLDVDRVLDHMRMKLAGRRYDFFWHHVGTTRMNMDPQKGVVDADCRVHGISNLFVAGSSVFPTEGAAPPTLTIVAMALRLGAHLSQA